MPIIHKNRLSYKSALLAAICTLTFSPVGADERLIGSWENDRGERMDIIDGFKPNTGPVIQYSKDEVEGVFTWRIDQNDNTLKMRYSSGEYQISDDGLNLNWDRLEWRKSEDLETGGIVNLKIDSNSFIDQLTRNSWSANSLKVGKIEFTRTFSGEEGIVSEFSLENTLNALKSWGVASGALKVGSRVYLEARITPQYLIGVDDDDDFLVLNKGAPRTQGPRTTLVESREKFLAAMTTGAWLRPGSYEPDSVYRFRPIEGDLKGRVFREQDLALKSTQVWEFSPATGALKIGYDEYTGGMTVGELLILVKTDGKQKSYLRDSSVEQKQFLVTNVKSIPISERTAPEVADAVGRQLSLGSEFTLFEFSQDGRTGYVHEWFSYPFQITGQSIKSEGWGTYEQLHLIEDYVVFGEGRAKKIDLRQSRLKPKSDSEAKADAEHAQQELTKLQEGKVHVKVTRVDGSEEVIPLPIKSLGELKSIVVIAE